MNKQEILAKLNANRNKKVYKPNTLPITILATLQVSEDKGDTFLPYLSVVSLPEENRFFSVLHKSMPNFYENRPVDSFGADYKRQELQQFDADLLYRAILNFKEYVSTKGALQPTSFLIGYCLSKGLDLVEKDII